MSGQKRFLNFQKGHVGIAEICIRGVFSALEVLSRNALYKSTIYITLHYVTTYGDFWTWNNFVATGVVEGNARERRSPKWCGGRRMNKEEQLSR